MNKTAKEVMQTYFASWQARDFDTFASLLAQDATFKGPLGQAANAQECLTGIKGLSQIVTDIKIQQMWAEGDDVLTWFELHTTQTKEPLRIANWAQVQEGKVKKIQVTFDPRALFA